MEHRNWPDRLDAVCGIIGGLLPMGIIIGNACYESMIAIVGVLWIARSFLAKVNPLAWLMNQSVVLPWALMYAAILVSLAVNGPGGKGALHDIVYIRHLIFLLAIIDISYRIDIEKYFLIGIVGSILLAVVNIIIANLVGFDLMLKPVERYSSRLKEAARISGLFAYFSPMLIAWSFSLRGHTKTIRAMIFVFGLAALCMLFMMTIRTTIIAAGLGFCFWAFFRLFKTRSVKAVAVIVLFILVMTVAIGYYLSQQPFRSVYARASIYLTTWSMIKLHPWFGVGVSGYQDAYREIAATEHVQAFIAPDGKSYMLLEAMHAHNLPLGVLAAIGVIGFAFFLLLYGNILKTVFTQSKQFYRPGLVIWPVVFLVVGMTNLHFFGDWYQALFVYLTAFSCILKDQHGLPPRFCPVAMSPNKKSFDP